MAVKRENPKPQIKEDAAPKTALVPEQIVKNYFATRLNISCTFSISHLESNWKKVNLPKMAW